MNGRTMAEDPSKGALAATFRARNGATVEIWDGAYAGKSPEELEQVRQRIGETAWRIAVSIERRRRHEQKAVLGADGGGCH